MKQLIILCIVLLFWPVQPAQAMTYADAENVNIYGIVNDGDWLWLATWSGLVKYNKVTAETVFYRQEDQTGVTDVYIFDYTPPVFYEQTPGLIPHNYIRALNKDAEGNIWMICGGGLLKFNRQKSILYKASDEWMYQWPINFGKFILIDEEDNKWVGGLGCLLKFDNTGFEKWSLLSWGLDGTMQCGKFDNQGNLWLGAYSRSNDSFNLFNGTEIIPYNNINVDSNEFKHLWSVGRETVNAFEFDKDNNILIATTISGLAIFDRDETFIYFHTENSDCPAYMVMDMKYDTNGYLWLLCTDDDIRLANSTDYIVKYDGTDFVSWKFPYQIRNLSYSNGYYYDPPQMEIDPDGTIWIGTNCGSGLIKFSDCIFTQIAIPVPDPVGISEVYANSKPLIQINGSEISLEGASYIEAYTVTGIRAASVHGESIILSPGFHLVKAVVNNENLLYKVIVR